MNSRVMAAMTTALLSASGVSGGVHAVDVQRYE
jgi:hypothetical protein